MFNRNHTLSIAIAATTMMTLVAGTPLVAQAKVPQPDLTFMKKASRANIAEVKTSQLALKKSSDPKVQQIAQMLIDQHSKAQNQLKTLAQKHDVALPQTPEAKHQKVYRKLASLSGAAFNKQYLTAQMRAHHEAIALFKKEMASGKQSEVRSYAATVITDIYNHTKHIHDVAGGSYGINTGGMAMGSGMSNTSRAASSSQPMMGGHKMSGGNKMSGSSMSSGNKMGGSFTPAPRASATPGATPAPGIN